MGWMRHVKTFAALCLVLGFTAAAAQESVKIGFVNTERILRDAVPAKSAQQKLEQEFSKREKELQDMAARMRALGERLDRDAAVMSESDRQRRQREFREDLNQRRNEELSQVIDKANRVIKQIAEQEKYDVILQEAVFASPRVDITEKVLRALSNGKQ